MKRLFTALLALGLVCAAGGALRADVKTQEKSQIKFEGMLGRMVGMFAGKAAKEGVVSTVAVKGDRMMRVDDRAGQIIDLAEEKIYTLDMKKKTYTVTTFAGLRQKMEEARAKAEKEAKESKGAKEEPQQQGKEMEVDFDVKQTGQTRTIAGHETKEYIITITTREKGKTLEDGGGMVMTADTWMADKIPALAEIRGLQPALLREAGRSGHRRRLRGADGGGLGDVPGHEGHHGGPAEAEREDGRLSARDQADGGGGQEQGRDGPGAVGRGVRRRRLGGMLARKMARKKAEDASPRSTVFTSNHEVLSVEASAGDADVAIPAGFKEKK